ncbi:hypothetical protein [Streptomyces sp. NPDC023588]|uniref:hypothetical protein n=1 Tax=Streptomyces sp. NPDC023588 TaxID=3154907 RepID=UPI0033D5C598
MQDADRILLLLDHCPHPDTRCAVHPDAVAVLRALLNVAGSERVLPGIDPDGQARHMAVAHDGGAAAAMLIAAYRKDTAMAKAKLDAVQAAKEGTLPPGRRPGFPAHRAPARMR